MIRCGPRSLRRRAAIDTGTSDVWQILTRPKAKGGAGLTLPEGLDFYAATRHTLVSRPLAPRSTTRTWSRQPSPSRCGAASTSPLRRSCPFPRAPQASGCFASTHFYRDRTRDFQAAGFVHASAETDGRTAPHRRTVCDHATNQGTATRKPQASRKPQAVTRNPHSVAPAATRV